MFSMVLVGSGSVSFDTDPDSGSSFFLIRIRIQGNYTDSTDPDPPHCVSLSSFCIMKILALQILKYFPFRFGYKILLTSVVDPNTLKLDPDPGFYHQF